MSKTTDEIRKTLAEKYADFDYDAETDELFQLARRQINKKRESGVSDTLARYAANTGMAGSSEAMAAAQQTAAHYDRELSDTLFDAEEKAYKRWSNEKSALERALADGEAAEYEYQKALAEAEAKAPRYGRNGMSEEAFEANLKRFDADIATYTSLRNSKKTAELVEMKRILIGSYYGFLTEDYKNEKSNYIEGEVLNILSNLDTTRVADGYYVQYIDMSTYATLASYFDEHPYISSSGKEYRGEDALRILNVVPMG